MGLIQDFFGTLIVWEIIGVGLETRLEVPLLVSQVMAAFGNFVMTDFKVFFEELNGSDLYALIP